MTDTAQLISTLEKELGVEEAKMAVPLADAPLPEQVRVFTESIQNTFEKTAISAEVMAARLEAEAARLRERAQQLRSASPAVRETVENWIKYERTTHEREKFFSSLFEEQKPMDTERRKQPLSFLRH